MDKHTKKFLDRVYQGEETIASYIEAVDNGAVKAQDVLNYMKYDTRYSV